MFKNMIVYRIAPDSPCLHVDLTVLEEGLARTPFQECAATQEKSSGWLPPRGEAHGPLAESVSGQWMLRFMTETKAVPGPVLTRRVKEKAEQIEQQYGRKPGKKEMTELKDEVRLDLLPMAFTKQTATFVWLNRQERLLVLDTSAQGRADEIVSALVEALPGLSVALLETQVAPQTAMAQWLIEQEPPAGFSIDQECELKATGEGKSVVRYAHHPLDIEEIQAHIKANKLPTKLAMTWDNRVSFVLTEGLHIKKVAFLETVFEGQAQDNKGFDADVALATGELAPFIADLVEVLGGEPREALARGGKNEGDAPF